MNLNHSWDRTMNKTLLDCGYLGNDNIRVYDYTSIDLNEVKEYLNTLDKSWFEFIKVYDNSKIEKICYDYYNNSDYYDLILFLNGRDMLYDMGYDSDVNLENAENDIRDYEFRVYRNDSESIYKKTRERLINNIIREETEKNLKLLYMKMIKKERIHEVKRKINEILTSQKEMFKLLDYLND